MIKARAGRHLLFGLSRGNCERLLKGEPIFINGDDLGLPRGMGITITIMGGETEEAIAADLRQRGLISEDTVIVDGRPS